MPSQPLSDALIRSLPKLPKQYDVWDSTLPRFGIRVSVGGTKTFVLNQDKVRRTIGRYPTLSLSAARTEAKKQIAERTLGRFRPQSITYAEATKLFLEEKTQRRKARTVKDYTRHLALLNFKCQLAEVTFQDLERKLKRLSAGEFNHRLVAAKVFFSWAHKRRYITDNPTISLASHTTTPRSRILTDEELKAVWTAAWQIEGHFGTIVKLLITTGQRRGEIAALKTSYYSHNQQTICLPTHLTKNHREHTFPLHSISTGLLATATSNITNSDQLLFPARGNSGHPFSGWSKSKVTLDKLANIAPWTLHDLRRTYRSTLPRLGVAPHICERLVNHISARSQMEQTYDHYAYWEEMKAAVQKHNDWLSSLVG